MKVKNLFNLGEPSFTNGDGSKWWLMLEPPKRRRMKYYRGWKVESKKGKKSFVIIDHSPEEPWSESCSFEAMCYRMDLLEFELYGKVEHQMKNDHQLLKATKKVDAEENEAFFGTVNSLVRNQFVGSNGDAPTRIHQTMYEAKCANHDFIDVFSDDGFHVTSWKRKEDGTYTDDF